MHRCSVLLTARENFPVSSWHMALLSRWRQFKFYSSLSRTKNLPLTTERTELRAQHVDYCSDVSNTAQQEGDQRRSVAVAVSVITDSKVRTSRNIHEKKGCLFGFALILSLDNRIIGRTKKGAELFVITVYR